MLRFIWDRAKNDENVRKHGFDFADAHRVFDGPMLVALDDREYRGEDRWVGLGFINSRAVVIVLVAPHGTVVMRQP